MSWRRAFVDRVIAWVALPGLTLVLALAVVPAIAQTSHSDYTLLIGSGFLCDSGDSSACPAVVKSADGASYEMSGAGTFAAQSKSATAAGTFTHKSTDGVVLETGVWVASELVSFDSYGIAPGALMREGRALGPPQFGPRRMGMFNSPVPAGGLAVLRIRLLPISGFAKTATLQVNCALGKVPDEHPTEGVRLSLERGISFEQEVSGRTIFMVTRPEPKAAEKSSAQKPPAPDWPGVESEPNTATAENPR